MPKWSPHRCREQEATWEEVTPQHAQGLHLSSITPTPDLLAVSVCNPFVPQSTCLPDPIISVGVKVEGSTTCPQASPRFGLVEAFRSRAQAVCPALCIPPLVLVAPLPAHSGRDMVLCSH